MPGRLLLCLTLLVAAAGAAELPDPALGTAGWVCTEGVAIADGIVTLRGDPGGYPRATLVLPGEAVAGKSLRFSAEVITEAVVPGSDIAYASPKLKVIDDAAKKVLAVNNFGAAERKEWTTVDVEVTIAKGQAGPVAFEIGLQLCAGVLKARNVAIAEVKPWRWRVLDGGHKSYFDK